MASLSRVIVVFALFVFVSAGASAQLGRDFLNDPGKSVKKLTRKGGSGLSESEVGDGLKEALRVGAKNATSKVSAPDGFFGNALIKVLMPPEAQKVEKTLRDVGLGDQVDNTILSMNRAAEDACTKAVEIFIDAIMKMSIQDAMAILKGGNNAATNYLKDKTTTALTNTFRPVIQESLDKVNATKYWATMFNTYNKLPTTFKKVNPDLPAYVTERALNGVFVYIAEEEAKIRTNPAARVSDLLKKVFGNQN